MIACLFSLKNPCSIFLEQCHNEIMKTVAVARGEGVSVGMSLRILVALKFNKACDERCT